MSRLLDHPCCLVTAEPAMGILRFARTDVPYRSIREVIEVHGHVATIFDRLGRERHTLLVDMRHATLNNDPAFEEAGARGRAVLTRGFGRIAVLVQTAVGALQVGRHLREDRLPGEVFTDEAQAIEYLRRYDRERDEAPASGVSFVQDGPFTNLTRLKRR